MPIHYIGVYHSTRHHETGEKTRELDFLKPELRALAQAGVKRIGFEGAWSKPVRELERKWLKQKPEAQYWAGATSFARRVLKLEVVPLIRTPAENAMNFFRWVIIQAHKQGVDSNEEWKKFVERAERNILSHPEASRDPTYLNTLPLLREVEKLVRSINNNFLFGLVHDLTCSVSMRMHENAESDGLEHNVVGQYHALDLASIHGPKVAARLVGDKRFRPSQQELQQAYERVVRRRLVEPRITRLWEVAEATAK